MIKNLKPKLAEAGKIKIGGLGEPRAKRGGGTYRIPVKWDHFKITNTIRDANGDLELDTKLMELIETEPDGKIRAIPIVLHSDNIDAVFPTSYALYSGKKCACRGDGEIATRREIKEKEFTGAEKEITCPCSFLGALSGPKCKPTGKLYCSITVKGASVAGAVHIFRTTSIISIEQMLGSLEQIKAVCGTLRGVPLWLMVKPVTVEPRGSGPITVFCCHVELRSADIDEIQRRALQSTETRRKLAADEASYRKMLTAPGVGESSAEAESIEAEFYPEDIDEDEIPEVDPGLADEHEPQEAEPEPDEDGVVPNVEPEAKPEPAAEPEKPTPVEQEFPTMYAIKNSNNGAMWISGEGCWDEKKKRLYYDSKDAAETLAERVDGTVIPFVLKPE